MNARFNMWAWVVLVGASQWIGNTLCRGAWWVATGRGLCPDPDEPLSSVIGKGAVKGKRWALYAERVVDRILGANHCRENIVAEKSGDQL